MDENSRPFWSRWISGPHSGRILLILLLLGVLIGGLATPIDVKFYVLVAGTWVLTAMFYPLWWLGLPALSWIGSTLYIAFVLHGALRRSSRRRSGLPASPFASPSTASWFMALVRKSSVARFVAKIVLFVGPSILWAYGTASALLLVMMMGYVTEETGGDLGLLLLILLLAITAPIRPVRKVLYRYPYYFIRMMDRRMRHTLERMRAAAPGPGGPAAP